MEKTISDFVSTKTEIVKTGMDLVPPASQSEPFALGRVCRMPALATAVCRRVSGCFAYQKSMARLGPCSFMFWLNLQIICRDARRLR